MGMVTGRWESDGSVRGPRPRRTLMGLSAGALACALAAAIGGSAAASVRAPAAQRGTEHSTRHDNGGGHRPGAGHRDSGSLWLEGVAEGVTASSAPSGSSGSTGGTFTIAKGAVTFTVTWTSTTRFAERDAGSGASASNLADGDLVVVQGSLTGIDAVTASRIRVVAGPGVPIVVSGTVSSIGSSSTTTTGTASCSTGSTTNDTFTISRGENGLVQITVTATPTTTYELVGGPGFAPDEMGGSSASSTSTESSTANAGSSSTGIASFCDLAVGDRVVVRGSVTGSDALTATSVLIRAAEGTFAVGTISAITLPSTGTTATDGSFTLQRGSGSHRLAQETVDVTPTTMYADLGPWPLPMSSSSSSTTTGAPSTPTTPGGVDFGTLAVGDHVAIRGTVTGQNTVTASLVVLLPSFVHPLGGHHDNGGHQNNQDNQSRHHHDH